MSSYSDAAGRPTNPGGVPRETALTAGNAPQIKGARSRRRANDVRYQRLADAVWRLMFAAQAALPSLQNSTRGKPHAQRLRDGIAAVEAIAPAPNRENA